MLLLCIIDCHLVQYIHADKCCQILLVTETYVIIINMETAKI